MAGTDYSKTSQPPFAKALLRRALLLPYVNTAVVAALRALPDYPWKSRVPVAGRARLRLDDGGSIELLRAERCHVAKEIFWGRGTLGTPAERLALDLAVRLSVDAALFLDIGAYTGLFALAVARRNPALVAHAYEIVGDNFLLLWENVMHNDLVGRVEPHLVALGGERGAIHVPPSMGAGTLASSVALDSSSPGGVRIPVDTLDALYAGFEGRVVVKIDVEGFEWDIFQGGERFIERNRPDIVCEVLRRATHVADMEAFLRRVGYRVYHISDAGLREAERIVAVKLERDWLFSTRTPQELRELGFPIAGA